MSYRTPFEEALDGLSQAFKNYRERSAAALEKLNAVDLSKRDDGDLLAKTNELREAMRERHDIYMQTLDELDAAHDAALAALPDFARWLGDSGRAIGPRATKNPAASIGDAILNHRQDIRR